MTRRRAALAVAALTLAAALPATSAAQARLVRIGELQIPNASMDQLRADWVDQLLAHHPQGTWAPMRFDLTDRDLALMGLPPKRVLTRHRYSVPTAVYPDGRMVRLGASRRGVVVFHDRPRSPGARQGAFGGGPETGGGRRPRTDYRAGGPREGPPDWTDGLCGGDTKMYGIVLMVAELIALFAYVTVTSIVSLATLGLGCVLGLFLVFAWVAILALHVTAIVKGVNGGRLIIPGISEYANRF